MNKCEKCPEDGHYMAELNRVLCDQHAKELSVRHELWLDSVRALESLVFDMTFKYQSKLNEKEISHILRDVSKKVFDNPQLR